MFLASARWLLDQVTAHVDDVMERAYADACRTRDEADCRARRAETDLAVERAVRIQQEARLASSATTIDFLIKELNTLNLERAALLARLTGVELPHVQIEHGPPIAAIKKLDDLVEQIKNAPQTDETSAIQQGEAQAVRSLFEDIGDEAAHKLGVSLDPRGVLVSES